MRILILISGLFCLVIHSQAQSPGQIGTNAPASQGTNAPSIERTEIAVSDGKVSDALVKWLDKLATSKPEEKETWWSKAAPMLAGTVIGGVISAAVTFLGLWMTGRREAQRDKETSTREEKLTNLRADLEKQKVQFLNQLEADLAKFRAGLDENRDAAKARRDEQLEELRANLEIAAQVFKNRQERLEKFHAPLRALLQQSRGVTDKLCYHVYRLSRNKKWPSASKPDLREYAFLTREEAESNKRDGVHPPPEDGKQRDRRLRVWDDNKWVTFRMLDFMSWLKDNPECRVLVDQILAIGRKKTAVISTYGGLAAVGQQPSPLFGEYLAHFAVLEAIYNNPPPEPALPESQKVGYYPRGMDAEIEGGYVQARAAVAEYESLAATILTRWSSRATTPSATPAVGGK